MDCPAPGSGSHVTCVSQRYGINGVPDPLPGRGVLRRLCERSSKAGKPPALRPDEEGRPCLRAVGPTRMGRGRVRDNRRPVGRASRQSCPRRTPSSDQVRSLCARAPEAPIRAPGRGKAGHASEGSGDGRQAARRPMRARPGRQRGVRWQLVEDALHRFPQTWRTKSERATRGEQRARSSKGRSSGVAAAAQADRARRPVGLGVVAGRPAGRPFCLGG
jgi:hypothetical protein